MKKTLLVILFSTFASIAFCQKPNEKIRQLESFLQQQGFYTFHRQSSVWGEGITHEWFTDLLFPKGFFEIDKSQRQQFLSNKLMTILDSIRPTCLGLIKEATESYITEIHHSGPDSIKLKFDTIKYIMYFDHNFDVPCSNLEDDCDSITKFMKILPQESLMFSCNNNSRYIQHSFRTPSGISWDRMRPFDITAFEERIQPVIDSCMAIKGAKVHPIYWRHDDGFEDFPGGANGGLVHKRTNSNNKTHSGLTTGTHYFIPVKTREEATRIFISLNAIAYDYVNKHPEQTYTYHYPRTYLDINTDNTLPYNILEGIEHKKNNGYNLSYMFNEDGFHILSLIVKGELWIPREWPTLKSYINGEKIYR